MARELGYRYANTARIRLRICWGISDMAIEEDKNLPVEDVNAETAEVETTDEVGQAELDNVSGGRAKA